MGNLNPYLTFNGNCREAMNFYQRCLGGELYLQTVGDSPFAADMPRRMRNCILHSTLSGGAFTLMGSDMVGEEGLVRGNAVSLMLNCSSEAEVREYYERLSAGGEKKQPVQTTHWGALFGDLTDRFGTHWLVHFQLED